MSRCDYQLNSKLIERQYKSMVLLVVHKVAIINHINYI